MNITIVKANPNHLLLLQAISKATFTETFAPHNTESDLNKYLSENLSIAQLEKELNNENSLFFFAIVDDLPAGYLKLNFSDAQTEQVLPESLEIERIYVLQAYQRQKVGLYLFQKAIEVAHENFINTLWLGVWEENKKAINFYKKQGFEAFDKHIFKLGNDEQTDILMRISVD